MSKPKMFDFSGWATKNDLRCSDGRTIRKNAFKDDDGRKVPLVWMHQHNDPENVLGHAVLENREEGVYAYCSFNDTHTGKQAREIVRHGDVCSLSIYANNLKQEGGNVLHGSIKEVSVVLAGANPGAIIDFPMLAHGEGENTSEAMIRVDEPVELFHAEEGESDGEAEKAKPEEEKKEDEADGRTIKDVLDEMTDEQRKVTEFLVEQAIASREGDGEAEEVQHADDGEAEVSEDNGKTVKDVLESMTEEQRDVVTYLVGMALEGEDETEEDDDNGEEAEHSDNEGEELEMKHNVFEGAEEMKNDKGVLSHADGMEIIEFAKANGGCSLKAAIDMYMEDNNKTLAHANDDLGFKDIDTLFPEYELIKKGAPEKISEDLGWVTGVLNKVSKSPKNRLRVRFTDKREFENRRARAYKKGTQKEFMGNLKLLGRTVDPTTVYNLDHLNRDDVQDITDFDLINYMYQDQDENLKTELARQIMIGDGRNGDINGAENPEKIDETKIIPIWTDDDLFTIHALVDFDAMKTTLQGTDTSKHFGDGYVFSEAIIQTLLFAREDYRGSGSPDFYCTPRLRNQMLLARDFNGRRIYDNVNDLTAAMDVNSLITVEMFKDKTRTVVVNGVQETRRLLGILVNLKDYTTGMVKGGQITHFSDFDIRFNQHLSLLETRLCGMLDRPFSAIVLEEKVNPQ